MSPKGVKAADAPEAEAMKEAEAFLLLPANVKTEKAAAPTHHPPPHQVFSICFRIFRFIGS